MAREIRKVHYIVTRSQVLLVTLSSSILAASAVLATSLLIELSRLPIVVQSKDGACVRVESRRNGESYHCQDVNVSLREYKVTTGS